MAINSAGTLVGAILETAGYIYQEQLLNSLTDPLKNEIGALIYLLGVVIAIVQFTVLKSAKMAPWLLLGPAIFFAILLDRTSIDQAKWSFGSNERDQAKVTEGTENVTDGRSGSANVSKVFKKYVTMISDVTRAVVDTINGVQIKNDLWFIAKGQFYGAVTNFKEDSPGLEDLIHFGLTGHCYEVIQAAKAVNNPVYRQNASDLPDRAKKAVDNSKDYFIQSQSEALKHYNELLDLPKYSFANNSSIQEFIRMIQQPPTIPVLGGGGLPTVVSLIGQAGIDDMPQRLYSCRDIWGFVLAGIYEKAEAIEKKLGKKAEELGIEQDAIWNLIGQAAGKPGEKLLSTNSSSSIAAEDIVRIISKYYLRNEMQSTNMGAKIAMFAGRADIRKLQTRLEGDFSASERDRLSVQEWSEKERLAHASYTLPVYQGLFLYFLGMTFPFFALLLLIPGKAQGFLLWFALWLWAKSWDIGLAIVMQLDTIFWSLYAIQKQNLKANEEIPQDFAAAMTALQEMDPTFQMSGYYAMLAVCLLAIPPVTGNLILGSMRAGSNLVSAGVNQMADYYANNMAARVNQGVVSVLKNDSKSLGELRGLAYAIGGQGRRDLLGAGIKLQGKGLTPVDPKQTERVNAGLGTNRGDLGQAVMNPKFISPNHIDVGRVQANTAKKTGIDHASGIVEPFRVLGGGYSQLTTNFLKLNEINQLTHDAKTRDAELATIKSAAASEASQANFESTVDSMAYELHRRIATFGGIPVPWVTEKDEGSKEEVARYVEEFKLRMKFLEGYIDKGATIFEIGKSPLENVFSGKTEKEKKEADLSLKNVTRNIAGIGVGYLGERTFNQFLVPYLDANILDEEQMKEAERIWNEKTPQIIKQNLNAVMDRKDQERVYEEEYQDPRKYYNMELGGEGSDLAEIGAEGRRRPSKYNYWNSGKN